MIIRNKFFRYGLHAKGKGLAADGEWILDPGTTAQIESENGAEWFVRAFIRKQELRIFVGGA